MVKANGSTVTGSVRHPLSALDFSLCLPQAQLSKAQILDLTNAGDNTINSVKAVKELGITETTRAADLLVFINGVYSLGLQMTEGLLMADS